MFQWPYNGTEFSTWHQVGPDHQKRSCLLGYQQEAGYAIQFAEGSSSSVGWGNGAIIVIKL